MGHERKFKIRSIPFGDFYHATDAWKSNGDGDKEQLDMTQQKELWAQLLSILGSDYKRLIWERICKNVWHSDGIIILSYKKVFLTWKEKTYYRNILS